MGSRDKLDKDTIKLLEYLEGKGKLDRFCPKCNQPIEWRGEGRYRERVYYSCPCGNIDYFELGI